MSGVDAQTKSIIDALMTSPDKNIGDTHKAHEHSVSFFHTVEEVK